MAKKLRRNGTRSNTVPAAKATTPPGISLKGRACDQMAELSTVLQAYLTLERLISTDHQDQALEGVPASCAGLAALLHLLNDAMRRRIDAMADSTTVLLAQLAEGGGEVSPGVASA